MPPRGEKIEKAQLSLIKNWIAQGMLPTASGKPMKKKNHRLILLLGPSPWKARWSAPDAQISCPAAYFGYQPCICTFSDVRSSLVSSGCTGRPKTSNPLQH